MRRRWYGALAALALCFLVIPGAGYASAGPRQSAAQWLRQERVRCLSYLSVSEKTEEHVRRTREMGFNCALSMTSDAPVAKLMLLVRAADKHGLRIIWVSYITNPFASPTVGRLLLSTLAETVFDRAVSPS